MLAGSYCKGTPDRICSLGHTILLKSENFLFLFFVGFLYYINNFLVVCFSPKQSLPLHMLLILKCLPFLSFVCAVNFKAYIHTLGNMQETLSF